MSIDLAALAIKLAVGASPDDQLEWTATERFRSGIVFRTVRPHRVPARAVAPSPGLCTGEHKGGLTLSGKPGPFPKI